MDHHVFVSRRGFEPVLRLAALDFGSAGKLTGSIGGRGEADAAYDPRMPSGRSLNIYPNGAEPGRPGLPEGRAGSIPAPGISLQQVTSLPNLRLVTQEALG